jgi:hypothetical protein
MVTHLAAQLRMRRSPPRLVVSLFHNLKLADTISGLGQAWLARAQAPLARIHREEGSSSSGSGSAGRPGTSGSQTYTASDDARDFARSAAQADARLHTADYVEARGILLPATEYFKKAVEAADSQSKLTGDLLSLVRIHIEIRSLAS